MPATAKRVSFSALNIHRVVGGKIREGWLKWDTLDYLQQLGVIPPMGDEGD
jgi:predicted ester cyclase